MLGGSGTISGYDSGEREGKRVEGGSHEGVCRRGDRWSMNGGGRTAAVVASESVEPPSPPLPPLARKGFLGSPPSQQASGEKIAGVWETMNRPPLASCKKRVKPSPGEGTPDGEDRISGLPDSLIHHILSFLQLRHVIGTSVLSRRWRYLWASVPVLDFGRCGSAATAFVDRSLMLYEGRRIRRFSVDIVNAVDACHIGSWMRFAVRHEVEELDVDFYDHCETRDGGLYRLPRLLLDCGALRILKLGHCVLDPPAASFCFPSLTDLHLYVVGLTGLDTSGCPLLQNLIIEQCDIVRIYAPNQKLRYLKVEDTTWASEEISYGLTLYAPCLLFLEYIGDLRWKYNFKHLSSIRGASLDVSDSEGYSSEYQTQRTLAKLLNFLGHAKTLKLSQLSIVILAFGQLNNLKMPGLSSTCLELETSLEKSELPGIVSLLRSSHCLESLTIKISDPNTFLEVSDFFDETVSWELLELALSDDLKLKTVMIHNFLPSERFDCELGSSLDLDKFLGYWAGGIKLVKLLLKGCKMLDKLIISTIEVPSWSEKPVKSEMLLGLAKKLILFPRASASAEI